MFGNILDDILAKKRELIEAKRPLYKSFKEKLDQTQYTRYSLFKRRLTRSDDIQLIAEVKKASPSKGMIRDEFDPVAIAEEYARAEVAAISVLTEEHYFLGKPAYIRRIGEVVQIPLLTKDFILDECQIYEARHIGASAVLLIVRILDDATLRRFIETAHSLDLDCLVETHNEEEIERAVDAGAEIIGINNRDLETFEVDLQVSFELLKRIPRSCVSVAESGIETNEDVRRLKDAGANAVLIGEALMRSQDIPARIKELMHAEYKS